MFPSRTLLLSRPREVAAHQSSRNEGSFLRHSGIPRRCHRTFRDGDVRQLDGRGVCQQARRHRIPGSVLADQPPSEMDREFRRPSRCEVSSRASQCPGRSSKPLRASHRDRVVSPPSGGEITASRNPSIGLFATSLNVKLPLYCSLVPDPRAVFEDAFRHPWDDLDLYRFPPFALIGQVIARVQESSRIAMTLVAPFWPEKECFADLLLLTKPALALPWWNNLPRQPHCNLFHQGVYALNLHAWRLSSVTSESWAFREGLLESFQGASDPPPRASTSRGGRSSVVGVVEGALLQSTPLPVVVDFLIHLRHNKGFSVSAVKGYTSALNSVLTLKDRDLASSREITMLLRSFRDRLILSSCVLLLGT